jgi:integrase/recombinase XerD
LIASGDIKMSRKRLNVDWGSVDEIADLNPYLIQYRKYLMDFGLRKSTIESYVILVRSYLAYSKTNRPATDDFAEFRDYLHGKNLSRSTLNNYSFAIKKYHEMWGEKIEYHFLQRNDEIPYYFDEDDVLHIFSVMANIKHLAMFQTLFYGCLRASELCNLDDGDVDLNNLKLRVREGKGGRDGIVLINSTCAHTLQRYLKIRPPWKLMDSDQFFIPITATGGPSVVFLTYSSTTKKRQALGRKALCMYSHDIHQPRL